MYLLGAPGKGYDAMLQKFNEELKKRINATVKVTWIGWADYKQKYPLVLSSGEPIDLIYTANWLNYSTEAQKGAFMPLTDLLKKYAPKSYAEEPKKALDEASINGKLYALPSNYTYYDNEGYIMRGDLMQKYNIGPITSIDDYGKYLDTIKQHEPSFDPTGYYNTANVGLDGQFLTQNNEKGIDSNLPLAYTVNDPHPKLVNYLDEPRWADYFKQMKDWADKGYWSKSVLSNKDDSMFDNGKAASKIWNVDHFNSDYINHPEWKVQFYPGEKYSRLTSYTQDAMAIPASAKNPERAAMMIELVRQNEDLYDLLTYGIKGTDFEIESDGTLKALNPENFEPDGYGAWGFREDRFRKDLAGSSPDLQKVRDNLKSLYIPDTLHDFTLNLDPIKNQYAAVSNVMQQYEIPLRLGLVDPVSGLKTLQDKLKAAGIDQIQTEVQKQIDAFLSSPH